jgi:ADP-heptose:LPS heptosyltransferase
MQHHDPSALRALLKTCRHILVIQTKFLGDTIWTIPFIENLRKNLPDTTISLVVKQGNDVIFNNHPAVSNVMVLPYKDVKKKVAGVFSFISFLRRVHALGADCVLDLTDGDRGALISLFSGARYRYAHARPRHARHRLFTSVIDTPVNRHMVEGQADFLEMLGLVNYNSEIHYQAPAAALASLAAKAPLACVETAGPKVVIHPGSRVPLHQWGVERYARLCDLLAERYTVFLVGGPGEKDLLDQVLALATHTPAFVSHSLSVEEFAALCSRAHLFVGNDSGPIHLAAASGAFVFGLYGPTFDNYAGPRTRNKYIFENKNVPCQPCVRSYCTYEHHKACLEWITPEEVFERIEARRCAGLLSAPGTEKTA